MLRSAVLPGWGQVYNHKPWKAVLVVGGEGFLAAKALEELGKENDAVDLASRFPEGSPEHDKAMEAKNRHMNLKVTYIWWAVAVHLLQMADAYVDAHLASFDAEFGPDESALAPGAGREGAGGTRVAVALRVRF